jgi:hypothetical protein
MPRYVRSNLRTGVACRLHSNSFSGSRTNVQTHKDCICDTYKLTVLRVSRMYSGVEYDFGTLGEAWLYSICRQRVFLVLFRCLSKELGKQRHYIRAFFCQSKELRSQRHSVHPLSYFLFTRTQVYHVSCHSVSFSYLLKNIFSFVD